MCSVPKIFIKTMKSESGFILVVAIIATVILMAVGLLALTTSTQDTAIAVRLVGERKAFSAAESGVNQLCLTLDPAMPAITAQIDAVNDPAATYTISVPVNDPYNPTLPATGSDITGGKKWKYNNYRTTVTGNDSSYKSAVSLSVGVKLGPVPDDPSYQ